MNKERRVQAGNPNELRLSFPEATRQFLLGLLNEAKPGIPVQLPGKEEKLGLFSLIGFLAMVHKGIQVSDFHNQIRDVQERERARKARSIALDIISSDLFPDRTHIPGSMPQNEAVQAQILIGSFLDITDYSQRGIPLSDEQRLLVPKLVDFSIKVKQKLEQNM